MDSPDVSVSPPPPPGEGAPRRRRSGPLYWVLGLGILFIAAVTAWATCGFGGCPDVGRLRAYQPGGATLLLDRNGDPFADLAPVHGSIITIGTLPKNVINAFVAVEDKRFWSHFGIDLWRVGGAFLENFRRGGIREGFSTIDMQLARNVFPDEIRMNDRTVWRKLQEIRVALQIERRYTKREILELYLNHIYFGNGARGIEAAARYYFREPAQDLTLPQAALLAAIPKAPSHYDPRRHPDQARERRNLVLSRMLDQGLISRKEFDAARKSGLGVRGAPAGRRPEERLAGYFVEEVRHVLEDRFGDRLYSRPLRVWTTLDVHLQQAAEKEIAQQLTAIERGQFGRFRGPRYVAGREFEAGATQYIQGAVVSIDVRTGDVLAWVGGRDFMQSQFDRVEHAKRQAGSAFKPFVYAAAIAQGYPLSRLLEDQPLRIELARGRYWEPRNFSGDYAGQVTMREALVHSINVPTVRLAEDVGYRRISAIARRAGIQSEIDEVPSMALGTVAVSPLELTSAYTAFAGLGTRVIPRVLSRVETADGQVLWSIDSRSEEAIDPSVAYLINDTLHEATERGSGAPALQAGFAGPAAGKTGTTSDGVDAWFIGYTPEIVTGVWIGFDNPRQIVAGASGGRLAAPVWGRIMNRYYRNSEPPWWRAPSNVVQHPVDPETGLILEDGCVPRYGHPYQELFIRGSEPGTSCPERGYDEWAGRFPDTDTFDTESDETGGANSAPGEEPAPEDSGVIDTGRAGEPPGFDQGQGQGSSPGSHGQEQDQGDDQPQADNDLTGWWDLTNVVSNSDMGSYEGLALNYRISLTQDGRQVTGEGEKWAENGRRLPGSARTSIRFRGTVSGNRLHLVFTEYGTQRTTGGSLDCAIEAGGNALQGSFSSSAANSSGRSEAHRVF